MGSVKITEVCVPLPNDTTQGKVMILAEGPTGLSITPFIAGTGYNCTPTDLSNASKAKKQQK